MKIKSLLGYLFVALLSVTVLTGCGDGEDDTPTPSPTVEPTATPTATVEPTPTPTSTVEPTATPTPSTTEASNKAPIVNAGNDKTVQVNETVIITGTASDSDGTIVSYEWKKGNSVLATTLSFSYTPTVVGTDVLTLTVMDDDGDSSSDSVNVIVEEKFGGKSDVFEKIKG